MNFALKQPLIPYKRRDETRVHTAVIFFVICRKKRRKFYDMNIIVLSAQSPKTVGYTVYGA